MEEQIRVSFIGMEPTEALEKYAKEKFSKHDYLLGIVTNMEISLIQHVNHRGVARDFQLVVTAKVPKTLIKVNESGDDMYALIDSASDKVFRSLKRYMDKLSQWEGKQAWEVDESEDFDIEEEEDMASYTEYVPHVLERRKIQYRSPMDEAEAVERMELLGRDHLLFKNVKTGRISLLFKIDGKGYGIEEVPRGV